MLVKKSLFSGLLAIGISLPLFAQAADLTIVNNTYCPSTTITNNGACSTILGDSGVTKPHSTNVVTAAKIFIACIVNQKNCKADIYMTDDCTGPKVATVTFDIYDAGIKSILNYNTKIKYAVSGSSFHAELDGGPASGGDECKKNSN